MLNLIFVIAFVILAPVFVLAFRLRLGVPLAYAAAVSTVFRSWYLAHIALADGIFFALLALAALSWATTLVRWIHGFSADWFAERTAARLFCERVRQAAVDGEHIISTEGQG